tara:strand:- start:128 stop:556 length:429 start_codon:yes stop_codon:yes gene_type:complete
MRSLNSLFLVFITFASILSSNQIANAQGKIVIDNLITTSKGLDGKNISYPRFKQAELRLLKVIIPAGIKTPIHIHPSPLIVYVSRGRLKHTSDKGINFFNSGDSFVESNYGGKHFVENIGKNDAILFVSVSSVVGTPTTINK